MHKFTPVNLGQAKEIIARAFCAGRDLDQALLDMKRSLGREACYDQRDVRADDLRELANAVRNVAAVQATIERAAARLGELQGGVDINTQKGPRK
jgi:hypothetical protein